MSFVSTADSQSHPLINPKHPFKWRPNPANIVWLCVRRYLRYYFAWMLSILWLLLISWLAFFWNLGSTGLVDETEPLFAEAARQMTVTGDWITPFFNGVPRFDKPPLIYWLMAIAYQTFGVNEFAARLPSALAGFALTSCCFYTLRYFGSPTEAMSNGCCSTQDSRLSVPYRRSIQWQSWLVAYLGSAMVALNPLTLLFGRLGYSDMLLSASFGGALVAFFLGYAQPEQRTTQARCYLAFYILSALAVLTKGPVGVVLPGLIISCFLLYVGRAKEVIGEMRLVRGALIFLALSLPWYILVTLYNGKAYVKSFFEYHNFERFTSGCQSSSRTLVLSRLGDVNWLCPLVDWFTECDRMG